MNYLFRLPLPTVIAAASFLAACEVPQVPRPSSETFVTIDGITTRYRHREGPAPCHLLYLHGFAASVETWDALIARQPGGCTAWAFDQPGFGLSDRPSPAQYAYGPQAFARHASRFMEQMGIGRAFVAGNSMGGAVAMMLARLSPGKVEGLILIDAKYTALSVPGPFFLLNSTAMAELAFTFMTRTAMRAGLQMAYHDNRLVTPELVTRYHEPLQYAGSVPAWGAAFRELQRWSANFARYEARQITQPTTIIWGEDDLLLPLNDGYRLKYDIPGSDLIVLGECGHVPQEEMPGETARIIDEFIRAHTGVRPEQDGSSP
ncbi:MAG: alpha/beta hydrolase [Deltaproteobacteria bacterium]|nr:alpha/beta hydrolase [Deltaproteobacteria bacterium]